MNELKRTISSVIYQLHANAWLNSLLLGVSCAIVAKTADAPMLVTGLVTGLGFVAGAWINRLYEPKKTQAIHILHQTIGDTEYSLDLFDKSTLNIAEQLQIDRLNERIQRVQVPMVAFSNLGLYVGLLLVAMVFHFTYPLLQPDSPERRKMARYVSAITSNKPVAPAFESAELTILPPAYTRLPTTRSKDLNAVAVSGSMLSWKVMFSDNQHLSVRLVNSRGEEIGFIPKAGAFVHSDRLISSGLYAIKAYWKNPAGSKKDSLVYQSDFYRLEAQPDLAPKIQPDSKELYRYHYLKDSKKLSVSAKISDDFSVSQAFIVATVARGAGENVKFREVKIPLGQANFKESHITKIIDLKALNFTPGDELYYYWAAVDNKQPERNFSKSDTYFLVYKDTTNVEESELATMAVNIMPEYFRSQRQIIIDTDKLLARRKKLGKKEFNSISNEIGYDQKLLRLRYGQYLGEEFETNIGAGGGIPADAEGGNVLDGFMHKHDTGEGEHETNEKEHEHEHEHEHGHDHGAAGENADPLAALMEQYVHSHDDGEANTFYEQSTRSLLKMALEQMWQSELHLRMYEPEKARPYEQKALEFLKAAQHKARTFVKKSGYDPPPIKEKETRLTGELKNINATLAQERTFSQERVAQLVGEVLGYIDLPTLTATQRGSVQQLGSALAVQVVNSGLSNWSILTTLQKMASGKVVTVAEKQQLKTKLYRLTSASLKTTPSYTSDKKLEQAFWKRLR